MVVQVVVSRRAEKQLAKVPKIIRQKFALWVQLLKADGLDLTRLNKGLHDEPLRGKRKHQRSVRLSRAYRAFYELTEKKTLQIVAVVEVNKHEY